MTQFSKPHDLYSCIGFVGLSILPETVTKSTSGFIFVSRELTRNVPRPLFRYSLDTCIHSKMPSLIYKSTSPIAVATISFVVLSLTAIQSLGL